MKLRRIIFRKASRTHGYFLSSNAHARMDTFAAIGLQVYWYDELTKWTRIRSPVRFRDGESFNKTFVDFFFGFNY